MSINVHDRAKDQQTRFEQLAAEVRAQLAAARTERDRRHADPASVPQEDWGSAMGAAQHLQVARAALIANQALQSEARVDLAGVETPAQAGAQGATLADLLLAEATLQVSERDAIERVASGATLVEELGALVARADRLATAAAARTAWAETRQVAGDLLRAALGTPPLVTLEADAGAVLGGTSATAADQRLDDLLPADLRARAEERTAEALIVLENAVAHRAKAEETVADRGAASCQVEGDVWSATAALVAAEAALARYVSHAPGHVARATATLAAVVAQPDLSAAQVTALDPGARPDAVSGAAAEGVLAAKLGAVTEAQRDVDDAILAAVDAAPDADPELDPGVIAARAALVDVHDTPAPALDDARAAYAADSDALSSWEIEVPASLWDALASYVVSRRDLERLSSPATRTNLVAAIDGATDAVAGALDERDVTWRGDVEVALHLARRKAAEEAALAGAAARLRDYTRGSGASGRTQSEL